MVLFSRCLLRRLDTVFDEVAEEEGGEGFEDFEDQANPGKQPFDHDTLVFFGTRLFPNAWW